ncbi:MAG: redox-regulated ATPase YchF [Lentisphaerales bacterium]|jgi:GTP-binding protein YchF|nr:MAG: redox-regulated ATPase YchF [Lentisphaerales bacterium]
MKVGLLGYGQSGKRTLFSLLTNRDIPPGRSPSEPFEGVAPVRDARVDALSKMFNPKKTTYAENHIVLCPDIVVGSDKRDWLEPARSCDLLCILIRSFASGQVYHPAGSVDARRDHANLRAELLLTDLETIEKRLDRISKEKRAGQTPGQVLAEKTLQKCHAALEEEKPLADLPLDAHELASIRSLGFLTLKPALWAHNVDEDALGSRAGEETADTSNVFIVSCLIESEIMKIEDMRERTEYLTSIGLDLPGPERLNHAAYEALGLMSFYTIGSDEVRAWAIRKGSLAPTAAGKVHTDIERGFIRVEVVKFDDLVELGSEKAARDAGRMNTRGKDYVMEDGDICHFLFN